MSATRQLLVQRAQRIVDGAKAERRLLTESERAQVEQLILDAKVAQLGEQLASPIGSEGGGLYGAIAAEGWHRREHPSVTVPFQAAASFTGAIEDFDPLRVAGAPLGFDQRWLAGAFPRRDVDVGVTGIQSFRQASRTLPDPSTMVRDLTAVTPKPEVDTEVELVAAELKQIAAVESGVPNILLESSEVRDFANTDLRLAFLEALDSHLAAQIRAANPPNAAPGADLLAGARAGIAAVQDEGYNPTILAASPQDAVDLDLLQSSGTEAIYQFATTARSINASPLWGLRLVVVKDLGPVPWVIDPEAAGKLYISPLRFEAFEENAGATNSSTVRLEAHALFVVQRAAAIAEIYAGS